jgi:hypothetical protein
LDGTSDIDDSLEDGCGRFDKEDARIRGDHWSDAQQFWLHPFSPSFGLHSARTIPHFRISGKVVSSAA